MKKYLALLFACLMLLSLAACGSSGSSADNSSSSESTSESDSQETTTEENIKDEPVTFEVKEWGYGVNHGYLYTSVILHNPTDKVITMPKYRVTARSADGGIIGTGDEGLFVLYPGQDAAHAFQSFELTSEPAEISVEPIQPDVYDIRDPSSSRPFTPFEVVNYNISQGSYKQTITGEVTNPNDYDVSMVAVTVLFRDADGTLKGGDTTFIHDVLANSNTPFELSLFGEDDIITDTFELYAIPWTIL